MTFIKSKKRDFLIKYYQNFFNDNLFREFRFISKNKYYNKKLFLQSNDEKDKLNLLKKVISYRNKNANAYSEIYGFKDFEQFEKDKFSEKTGCMRPHRIYDRLYFDFDFDDPAAKKLKKDIETAISKQDSFLKKDLIKKYHKILLNDEIAKKPFEELKKLYNYLNDKNIKSYPVFSGSKGFHLYIFFPNHLFDCKSFNNVALAIFNGFKKTLNLQTLDKNVFQNPSHRVARLPYQKHPISELFCYPININDSYTKIIEKSFKPDIEDFDNSYFDNVEFSNFLNNYIEKEKMKIEENEKLEAKKRKFQRRKYKNTQNIEIGSVKTKIHDKAIRNDLINNIVAAGYIHGNRNNIGFKFDSVFRKAGLNEKEIFEIFKDIADILPHPKDLNEVSYRIHSVFKKDIKYIAGWNALKTDIEKFDNHEDLIKWFEKFFMVNPNKTGYKYSFKIYD